MGDSRNERRALVPLLPGVLPPFLSVPSVPPRERRVAHLATPLLQHVTSSSSVLRLVFSSTRALTILALFPHPFHPSHRASLELRTLTSPVRGPFHDRGRGLWFTYGPGAARRLPVASDARRRCGLWRVKIDCQWGLKKTHPKTWVFPGNKHRRLVRAPGMEYDRCIAY